DCSLSARAEFSPVYWMSGIAFELLGKTHLRHTKLIVPDDLRFAFHDPHNQAATRRAKRTHRRLPDRNARCHSVFRDEADQTIFRIAATCERHAAAGERCGFDEPAPIHISSDTSGSRSMPVSSCDNRCKSPSCDSPPARPPSWTSDHRDSWNIRLPP